MCAAAPVCNQHTVLPVLPGTAWHLLALLPPHICPAQAASVEECKRRCPGLVVRPMRTDRYREASEGLSCASHRRGGLHAWECGVQVACSARSTNAAT